MLQIRIDAISSLFNVVLQFQINSLWTYVSLILPAILSVLYTKDSIIFKQNFLVSYLCIFMVSMWKEQFTLIWGILVKYICKMVVLSDPKELMCYYYFFLKHAAFVQISSIQNCSSNVCDVVWYCTDYVLNP